MNKSSQKGYRTIAILLSTLVALMVVLVGWKIWESKSDASNSKQKSMQAAGGRENKKEKATGATITSGDSEFGTMLFNDKKQAIYIWELEESQKAACYGDCAEAWPPVLTVGEPHASGDVSKDLLGTTIRTDGSTQVTYNGHPLYYYAHEGAGEVKCHNIKTHGGLWWVIQPNGTRAD